jgi:uncharacterized protein (TIGR01244 family)
MNLFPTPAVVPVRAALALVFVAGALAACQSGTSRESNASASTPDDPMAAVNTVARDRGVWQRLLTDHAKIRRTLVHKQEGDLGIVETLTESDDPTVAVRIIDHAKAMQARMKAGAPVRIWDPVFEDLFARHAAVTLDVTPTDKGVRIIESSRDPEAIALMRSHAMGVSAFVRQGHEIEHEATPRWPVGPALPPNEVAIGGVAHRFLLGQPDAAQVAALQSQGVRHIVNFRKPAEHPTYDESAAAANAGMSYCNPAYSNAGDLSDTHLDQARALLREADLKGQPAALHCRTGNRVGPAWAAYRVLDQGIPFEQAFAEARAVGLVDPLLESAARDAVRRALAHRGQGSSSWSPIEPTSLSPTQAEQRARAEDARNTMFSRLFAALGQAMAKPGDDGQPVGPVGALSVCKQEAPKIAQAVAREKGLLIGRTSDQLRNPASGAPAWAARLLASKPDQPRFVANADGTLGVTLPIKLAASCVACHGPRDQIDSKVLAALHTLYPNDQATGYVEGDLRGWFWVEVPPTPTPTASAQAR